MEAQGAWLDWRGQSTGLQMPPLVELFSVHTPQSMSKGAAVSAGGRWMWALHLLSPECGFTGEQALTNVSHISRACS